MYTRTQPQLEIGVSLNRMHSARLQLLEETTTMTHSPGVGIRTIFTADHRARRLLCAGLLPAIPLLHFATAPAQRVHHPRATELAQKRTSVATPLDAQSANSRGIGRARLRRLSRTEYSNTFVTCVASMYVLPTTFPAMMSAMASIISALSSLCRRYSSRNTWPLPSRSRTLPFSTRTISSPPRDSPLQS
jgi:hypothetical protein